MPGSIDDQSRILIAIKRLCRRNSPLSGAVPAFNIRLRHLPSGLIDRGMQCGWQCFSRVLQADAVAFHRRFNHIRTFKPAGRRENPCAEEPVRRKLSLHGPCKHVVSAVAAIDAGDIQIFCFADNTGGKRGQGGVIRAGRAFHTYGKMEVFRFALCFWLCIGNN